VLAKNFIETKNADGKFYMD